MKKTVLCAYPACYLPQWNGNHMQSKLWSFFSRTQPEPQLVKLVAFCPENEEPLLLRYHQCAFIFEGCGWIRVTDAAILPDSLSAVCEGVVVYFLRNAESSTLSAEIGMISFSLPYEGTGFDAPLDVLRDAMRLWIEARDVEFPQMFDGAPFYSMPFHRSPLLHFSERHLNAGATFSLLG